MENKKQYIFNDYFCIKIIFELQFKDKLEFNISAQENVNPFIYPDDTIVFNIISDETKANKLEEIRAILESEKNKLFDSMNNFYLDNKDTLFKKLLYPATEKYEVIKECYRRKDIRWDAENKEDIIINWIKDIKLNLLCKIIGYIDPSIRTWELLRG